MCKQRPLTLKLSRQHLNAGGKTVSEGCWAIGRSPSGIPLAAHCFSPKIPSARAICITGSTGTRLLGAPSWIRWSDLRETLLISAKSTSPLGSPYPCIPRFIRRLALMFTLFLHHPPYFCGPEDTQSASIGTSIQARRSVIEQTPGYHGQTSPELKDCLTTQGNCVLLSGIGGDEVMGGVPSPGPELEDLIARAQFRRLAHKLKIWALQLKKPWIHLFWDASREFLPLWLVGAPSHVQPAPWLQPKFVKRHRTALTGYHTRTKLLGPLPRFQAGCATLESMRRQFSRTALPYQPPYEKRYPFLDRDLLEFMFAVPRDQVVRPAQRRSLMRRALGGIVPDEILNRKTKAYVARAQMVGLSRDWTKYVAATQNMALGSLGIVKIG